MQPLFLYPFYFVWLLLLLALTVECSPRWTNDSTAFISAISPVSWEGTRDPFRDDQHRFNILESTGVTFIVFGLFSPEQPNFLEISGRTDCGGKEYAKFPINITEGSGGSAGEVRVQLPQNPAGKYTSTIYFCLDGILQGKPENGTGESVYPWLTVILVHHSVPVWVSGIFIVLLLSLSALFSGLNLGLLSLDKTDLKVIINTSSATERREALKIVPVRNHGNYLLCSLVFSNVLVNTTLTVVMDEVLGGSWETVLATTITIVIFGEIVPQAVCCRYGLFVSAKTIWITKLFMFITFPIAYPVGKMLDLVLGEEIGAVYTRDRLKELMKLTRDQHGLESEELNIISGTLDMGRKTVKDVMTHTENMFMLAYETILTKRILADIEVKGFSRIPVYQGDRGNVVGLVTLRQLAGVDGDAKMPLKDLLDQYRTQTHLFCVFDNTRLDYMLKAFREGSRGHMAFVQRMNDEGPGDVKYETLGLVTLEDVLEEVLQAEIYDESDVEKQQEQLKQADPRLSSRMVNRTGNGGNGGK